MLFDIVLQVVTINITSLGGSKYIQKYCGLNRSRTRHSLHIRVRGKDGGVTIRSVPHGACPQARIAQVSALTKLTIASFARHREVGQATFCMIPKFVRAIFTAVGLTLYYCATEFEKFPNLPRRNDPRDSDVDESACDDNNSKPNGFRVA